MRRFLCAFVLSLGVTMAVTVSVAFAEESAPAVNEKSRRAKSFPIMGLERTVHRPRAGGSARWGLAGPGGRRLREARPPRQTRRKGVPGSENGRHEPAGDDDGGVDGTRTRDLLRDRQAF